MAFQLKANEPVSEGITRNVRSQIEKALDHVDPKKPGAKRKPHQRVAPENEAVPEVRKCFKKVRAALRLVREDLGDDLYHEENFCFRDAARPLTEVRDAEVLIETADKLNQQFPGTIEPGAFEKIHEALLANRQEVTRRVLDEGRAFAAVEEVATRALARLPDWRIERDGWAAVESGLRRVYRAGHRALALAAEDSNVANLHEWRKQAKYLWHQLQLLGAAWTGSEKEMVDQTHKLSTLLGEDHDLAVLRETLAADPLAYGGHRILKGVFAVIDRRREELEQQAFALGREIYKDTPKVFTNRIEAWMTYGGSQMKNGGQSKNLLKKLSRDPRLKLVIAKAKRQTRGKGAAKVENVTGIFLLIMAIASRFAKKKRARAIDELMDIIYLLVQVSLVLKENIFDRPEVREFFSQSSRQIYLLAQECVAMVLPKTKGLRPALASRSA